MSDSGICGDMISMACCWFVGVLGGKGKEGTERRGEVRRADRSNGRKLRKKEDRVRRKERKQRDTRKG